MDRYAKNAGAVFSLKYHIVWCPKFRREVLVDGVDERLKAIIDEVHHILSQAKPAFCFV